jgi:hypothetical protein
MPEQPSPTVVPTFLQRRSAHRGRRLRGALRRRRDATSASHDMQKRTQFLLSGCKYFRPRARRPARIAHAAVILSMAYLLQVGVLIQQSATEHNDTRNRKDTE